MERGNKMLEKMKGRGNRSIHTRLSGLSVISIMSIIMTVIIVNSAVSVFAAESWPTVDKIEADSYIVIDKNTGNVLLEKNSDKKIYPASLTKILTAIIAIENLKPDQEITVSKSAVNISDGESSIDLVEGEKLTFKELLYGMLLPSGNDAAKAIAEKTGGTASAFITMMNKRSKEIGTTGSSWNNPQGVTAESHYTTSRDLSVITRYALQNELFRTVVNTYVYSMAPTNKHPYSGWNVLENSNKLMRFQDEYFASDLIYSISGVKTGTTTAAGSNLISTAHTKNGLELICVLNGVRGDNSKNIWAYTRTLIEEAAKIKDGVQNILVENSPITPSNDASAMVPQESFSLYIGKGAKVDVTINKEADGIAVMTRADGKKLFTTKSGNKSNSSTAMSMNSQPVSESSKNISDGSIVTVNNTKISLYVIIGLAVIVVAGLCFMVYIIRSPIKGKKNRYNNNRNKY